MADPPPHHCKDCGLVFDSSKSLDVHLHYHKENLLSKWAQQPNSDESNNNHVKKNRTTAVPADSSDSTNMMSSDRYYQHHIPATSSFVSPPSHEEPAYVLGSGAGFPQLARTPTPNSCSSPSPHHPSVQTSNSYRYHPYQQYSIAASPDHHRNGHVTSSSPQQCEKCGFVCESGSMLIEHLSVAHPPTPSPDLFDHGELNIKVEPANSQAEILDLDSHKVHVYQPPPPPPPPPPQSQEHSVSALMSWVTNVPEKQRFQPHNGSGLSSPDCYSNVSTTTVTPPDHPDMIPHQQPSTYQFDHISQLGSNNQQQISSTQIPMVVNQQSQSKMLKPGNGTWKANDARRPKTYNCSACNKWFTSSGHLKRHYNTTLHKNAVKQSGAPDPATMPISSHHHPHKDPNYMSPQSPAEPQDDPPPPVQQPPPPQQQQQQQPPPHLLNHHFLPSPPNLMAGPPEVTGGLLLHTTPYQEVSPTPHTPTFLPFHHTPTYPPPQHPNFQPPHVSTDPQVTTSNISGNPNLLDIQNYLLETGKRDLQQEQLPLPSFAQFQQNNFMPFFSSFHPVVSSSDSNVGGLNPDQISSTFDSVYQPSQSPLGDSYDLENIQSSIDTKPFDSPSSSSNIGSSDINSNEGTSDDNRPAGYFTPSELSLQMANKYKINRLFQLKQIEENTIKINNNVGMVKRIKLEGPLRLNNNAFQIKSSKSDEDLPSKLSENVIPVKHTNVKVEDNFTNIKVEDNFVSSTIEHSPPPPIQRVETPTPTPIHKCVDCDKVFNKACYLTQHNKSFHSGVKPFKCERCGKRFTAEYLHQEHIGKHAGDKPYKCEICPKQFNHKTDLRRHMCLHTGDKPYACDYCGKGFIRKDHMLKHCETHKRRPTGRGFKQNSSLIVPVKQQQQMQHSPQASVPSPSPVLAPPPTHNSAAHTLQMVM